MRKLIALGLLLLSSSAFANAAAPAGKYYVTPLMVKRIQYSVKQAKLTGPTARLAHRLAGEILRMAEKGGQSDAQIPNDSTTKLSATLHGKTVELTLEPMTQGNARYTGITASIKHERKSVSGDVRIIERTYKSQHNGSVYTSSSYQRLVEEDAGVRMALMPATSRSTYIKKD